MNYTLIQPDKFIQDINLLDNLTPIEQIFLNRGIARDNIQHYLNTTLDDLLDPLLLNNMQQGAQMLISHLAAQDSIFVQCDSDMDGYTSAALLLNYLHRLFPGTIENNLTYRLHTGKQHGIILDAIPNGTQLVIIPDAGSNDIEQQSILKSQGIDVLILDHHEISDKQPIACVINNQMGDYPNTTLSGVGVVYKFCQYIDSLLGINYANDYFDLVAMGIVADVMDLRSYETKEIIKEGIAHIDNPFLAAFVKKQEYSLKGEVTPFGISFYIAPYVNAVIRVGTQQEKEILFESMLDYKAYQEVPSTKKGCKGQTETIVEQACRICQNAKSRQTKARDTALEKIENVIEEEELNQYPILIIQLEEKIDENLTGLIANQLMGKYHKPILLLTRYTVIDDVTGKISEISWRGSGRNANNSKLTNLRQLLADSGLTSLAAGHANAFGIWISDNCMEKFKSYVYTKLKNFDMSNEYFVDFIWQSQDIEKFSQTILDIGNLKSIWGKGIEEPMVAIEKINISKDNIILMSADKSPTIKIKLPDGTCLIKFKSSYDEYNRLFPEEGITTINIVGTCNVNEWQGNVTPQILIEDYEIIKKVAYYF